MSSDFTGDTPLVMGSVMGARVFGYSDGKLVGRYVPVPWESGENLAYHADRDNPSALEAGINKVRRADKNHNVATCTSCGFYAYTQGFHETFKGGSDEIAGVIEGYGLTTIGTKGFRCSKAKIVALLDGRKPVKTDGFVRPIRFLQRHVCFRFGETGATLLALIIYVLGFNVAFYGSPGIFTAVGILIGMLAVWTYYAGNTLEYSWKKYRASLDGCYGGINYKQLAENYPEAKWYTDPEQMHKDFEIDVQLTPW